MLSPGVSYTRLQATQVDTDQAQCTCMVHAHLMLGLLKLYLDFDLGLIQFNLQDCLLRLSRLLGVLCSTRGSKCLYCSLSCVEISVHGWTHLIHTELVQSKAK